MDIINFFLKYNFIFKYYLCFILFFNLMMFYNFTFKILKKNKINNKLNLTNNINLSSMFKKLTKISNNPIIFEYQLEQINKIDSNSKKFIQYKNNFINIYEEKKNDNIKKEKNFLIYKYYKKIKNKLINKKYNMKDIDDIIIKLLCINF